jgi:hypothetical protein
MSKSPARLVLLPLPERSSAADSYGKEILEDAEEAVSNMEDLPDMTEEKAQAAIFDIIYRELPRRAAIYGAGQRVPKDAHGGP